jgi:hypothetical protein
VAFLAEVNITASRTSRSFSTAKAVVMDDVETWMLLTDSGAIHHMKKKLDDFMMYNMLSVRLYVGEGRCHCPRHLQVGDGSQPLSASRHMLRVPKSSRRAS